MTVQALLSYRLGRRPQLLGGRHLVGPGERRPEQRWVFPKRPECRILTPPDAMPRPTLR